MKRLTTDTPDGNFETMLNFVYGKDGWAHIRCVGVNDDVTLTSWAAAQCFLHGCDDVFLKETSHEEIDETICSCIMDYPRCPVALAYCFATQACHLRSRLKQYENILFSEDGTELVSLEELREAVKEMMDNPPLTLEELREMDEDPVWVERQGSDSPFDREWALVNRENCLCKTASGCVAFFELYGKTWLAYRRKREVLQ